MVELEDEIDSIVSDIDSVTKQIESVLQHCLGTEVALANVRVEHRDGDKYYTADVRLPEAIEELESEFGEGVELQSDQPFIGLDIQFGLD